MAAICSTCLNTTNDTLDAGECPTCAANTPCQRKRRRPQTSGWTRYPPEYRTNRALRLADNPSCIWQCGRPANTADHWIPRVEGGPHTIDNLIPSCSRCNTARSNTPGHQFATLRGLDLDQLDTDLDHYGITKGEGGVETPTNYPPVTFVSPVQESARAVGSR